MSNGPPPVPVLPAAVLAPGRAPHESFEEERFTAMPGTTVRVCLQGPEMPLTRA